MFTPLTSLGLLSQLSSSSLTKEIEVGWRCASLILLGAVRGALLWFLCEGWVLLSCCHLCVRFQTCLVGYYLPVRLCALLRDPSIQIVVLIIHQGIPRSISSKHLIELSNRGFLLPLFLFLRNLCVWSSSNLKLERPISNPSDFESRALDVNIYMLGHAFLSHVEKDSSYPDLLKPQ